MKKNLYLVRHGQTLFNKTEKIQGFSDSPLTDLGIAQGRIAAEYFRRENIEFDAAFSSTSERASDTLEIITDLPYSRHKGLKEWNFGLIEGDPNHVIAGGWPPKDFFVPYGGESAQQFTDRISKTILEIMQETAGLNVLMVTHGGVLGMFAGANEKYAKIPVSYHLDNCTIFKFEFEDDIFTLVEHITHDFSALDIPEISK